MPTTTVKSGAKAKSGAKRIRLLPEIYKDTELTDYLGPAEDDNKNANKLIGICDEKAFVRKVTNELMGCFLQQMTVLTSAASTPNTHRFKGREYLTIGQWHEKNGRRANGTDRPKGNTPPKKLKTGEAKSPKEKKERFKSPSFNRDAKAIICYIIARGAYEYVDTKCSAQDAEDIITKAVVKRFKAEKLPGKSMIDYVRNAVAVSSVGKSYRLRGLISNWIACSHGITNNAGCQFVGEILAEFLQLLMHYIVTTVWAYTAPWTINKKNLTAALHAAVVGQSNSLLYKKSLILNDIIGFTEITYQNYKVDQEKAKKKREEAKKKRDAEAEDGGGDAPETKSKSTGSKRTSKRHGRKKKAKSLPPPSDDESENDEVENNKAENDESENDESENDKTENDKTENAKMKKNDSDSDDSDNDEDSS